MCIKLTKIVICIIIKRLKLIIRRSNRKFIMGDGASLTEVNKTSLSVIALPDIPDQNAKAVDGNEVFHHFRDHSWLERLVRINIFLNDGSNWSLLLLFGYGPVPLGDSKLFADELFLNGLQYNISIRLDSKILTSAFLKAAISTAFTVKGIAVMNDSFRIDVDLSRPDYRPVLRRRQKLELRKIRPKKPMFGKEECIPSSARTLLHQSRL